MHTRWVWLTMVAVGCEGSLLGGLESAATRAERPADQGADDSRSPRNDPKGPTPTDGAPTPPPPPAFTCQPGALALEPLQRLTRDQLRLSLNGLVGPSMASSVAAELAAMPTDLQGQAIEASERAYGFAETHVGLVHTISRRLGDALGAAPQQLDGCLSSSAPDSACLERALGGFAARAFRRSLTTAEVNEVVAVYRLGATRTLGVAAVVRYVLQSPDFLYRLEAPSRADRLALLLWDAPADASLVASNERLADPTLAEAELQRLLTHPLARQKLERFFAFWLRLGATGDVPTEPAAFLQGVDTRGLKAAATEETLQYLTHLALVERAGYEEMLTSRRSFASHPGLATLYGHMPVAAGGVGTMGGTRAGLLMRLPFVLHADGETHPIVRGAATRRRLLCQPLTFPSPDNFISGPDVNTLPMRQMLSTRQRTDLKTGTGSCWGCHASINPLGFAFEGLDALGRERRLEVQYHSDGGVLASHAVDDGFTLPDARGTLVARQGVAGLSRHLIESVEGPACFVQFLFEHYRQRPATPADGCTLATMDEALRKPGASLLAPLEVLSRETLRAP
jgi:hypothetical protein